MARLGNAVFASDVASPEFCMPISTVKAFVFGDEETAIKSVEAENASEAIYDLSGRRVSKALKGLYIINGKKVVK